MTTDTHKTIKVPYDWLKRVPAEALSNDDIPLFGGSPTFPLDHLSELLRSKLHIEQLKISCSDVTQGDGEQLLNGIGSPNRVMAVAVAPIDHDLFFVISEQDIAKLLSAFLTNQDSPLQLDREFIEPFYNFMAMEIVNTLSKVDFDDSLSFSLNTAPSELPKTISHYCDISVSLNHANTIVRLIIPANFRHAWKEYYAPKKLQVSLSTPLAKKIQMIIHIEAGKIQLTLDEWKKVKPGDFVKLDSCSLERSGNRGRVTLLLDGNLLFRGKLKDGNIKILENPLYHEDLTPMPSKKFDNEDEEDVDFSDEGTDFNDEESNFDELEETEENNENEDLLSQTDLSQLEELEEETSEKEESLDYSEKSLEHTSITDEEEEQTQQVSHPEKVTSKPVGTKDIPLDIVVEIGRVRMSIQKILELQPGNMLELDIHPERSVDLVVNGQKIATAELLSLGDNLGVRIIDIG